MNELEITRMGNLRFYNTFSARYLQPFWHGEIHKYEISSLIYKMHWKLISLAIIAQLNEEIIIEGRMWKNKIYSFTFRAGKNKIGEAWRYREVKGV